jgi:hypothetical protein
MKSQAHTWGTDIRRSLDVRALSEALARPGNDSRYWVSHGTVCTIDESTGEIDTKNPNAIWIGPEGVECDVRLEPLNIHVCCRYAGISAGDVTIYPPIRPGDLVLVNCPEGFVHLPVIVAIMHSGGDKQPLDPATRVPIFDNKRLLVYAKTAAIDIRNAGGVQVLIEQDGTVTTTAKAIKQGDSSASEHVMHGEAFTGDLKQAMSDIANDIAAAWTATGLSPPPPPSMASIEILLAGITAGKYLSTKVTAT